MSLARGTRLGPYEIMSPLGAGGMGEVYKAHDARLDRTVAVKVLPERVAADAVLRARFEREARAIAALSHPHICAVYDVGRQADTGAGAVDYIVMEYLDGETVADRITRAGGALPIDQVLAIGGAVADALDKAHRAGIVHRDLKPANVMLTRSGPKLLDFGLAKTAVDAEANVGGVTALTDAHTIVGTIHYMAPEQVEGREADNRTDLWALGALLYEMATGQRPFSGQSTASVMGAIVRDPVPPVSVQQPLAPAAFDHVVDRCLQKDPDERWQNAGDVKRQLQWIATGRSSSTVASPAIPTTPVRARWWLVAATLLVGVALGAALTFLPQPTAPAAARAVLSLAPPPDVRVGASSALSPDGRFFTFVGLGTEGPPRLYLRALDDPIARVIPGTEDASFPFWSPRSDAIGFFAAGKLKTVPTAGGEPRIITDIANGRGGTWSADGTILFSGQRLPIFRVSDRGGSTTPATELESKGVTGHRWPTFVGPREFVYTVQAGTAETGLYLGSLDSRIGRKLNGVYSNTLFSNGRLFFVANDMLVSQTLDLPNARLTDVPSDVAGPVTYTAGLGYAPISMGANGTLAYTPRGASGAPSELVWLDRQGRRLASIGAEAGLGRDMTYDERFSPDGTTLAVAAFRAATADIWLIDLTRMVASRMTLSDANDQRPIFSPAGDEVAFASNRDGPFNIYRKRIRGSPEETRVLAGATTQYPEDWSRDGTTILLLNQDPQTLADIWKVGRDGANPTPVLNAPFNEYSARLSPDGRWLAYTSDESGQPEVYVQGFPNAGGKWKISTQGGSEPAWRADGRELFYLAANQTLHVVSVQAGADFVAGRPTKLSDTVIDTSTGGIQTTHYAVTADGQRVIANVAALNPVPPSIVLNWAPGSR